MQKLRNLFIGAGFFWIFTWSIVGSILGVRINLLAQREVKESALMLWEKSVLASAHAHMNVMGITTILIGMSMVFIATRFRETWIKSVAGANLASVPLFGLGLCLEALYPPANGMMPWCAGITALGGIVYMVTMAIWAGFFFLAAMR